MANDSAADMVYQGSAVIYVLIAAGICLPPALALRLFWRSHHRAQKRQLPAGRFRAAALAALVALLYNAGTVVATVGTISGAGEVVFTAWQGVAVAIAWISFWVWLFMAIALGRDLGRTSGLR